LYLERARLVQRRHYLEQAETIARRLRDRRDVDAAKIQVLQADAAVSARRSELLQSEMAINNAQLRIRALVNSPRLPTDGSIELIPGDQPATVLIPVNVTDAMALAVENRAEVDRAMQQVYVASKRLDLATNELLPALDLVLETYVAGLRGQWDIGQAWTDQFEFGEPGYTVGLRLELPLGNRAARSLHLRRRLEMRQVSNSLQSTLETVRSDVSIAVNDVNTTHRQISAKRQAMRAAQAEVDYLYARWQLLPENGRSPSAMLDDLLRAQDRLAMEEQGAAQAQLGILLQADAGQPPAGDSE
jgi:outer membrane protein TolC